MPSSQNAQAAHGAPRHGHPHTPDRRIRDRRVPDSQSPGGHAPEADPGRTDTGKGDSSWSVRGEVRERGQEPATRPAADPAGEVVRWAAFSCLLVPVVLMVYGTSPGGAATAAIGLAAVTVACRLLLRRSERAAGPRPAEEPGPYGARPARDLPEGGAAEGMAGRHAGKRPESPTHRPPGSRRSRTGGQGAHRGSRARGESAPGD